MDGRRSLACDKHHPVDSDCARRPEEPGLDWLAACSSGYTGGAAVDGLELYSSSIHDPREKIKGLQKGMQE